ncbi:low-density lipoprotein receptor-related protein 10-like, partial [Carcharodon carcharias]|uniref:low-density lipoprotein receptor-related protein 10-like n=1 Tax=Carcharodon carcharias TaxID=13397 RepID=UPI001B7DFFA9
LPLPHPCRGTQRLGGFFGSFSSPDSRLPAGAWRPPCRCRWNLDPGDPRPLLLTFRGLALGPGDLLEVREGGGVGEELGGGRLLGSLSGRGASRLLVASGSAWVGYISGGGWGTGGFNATYQVRGYCLPGELPCRDGGAPACFEPGQRCDGRWDCEEGADEEGCGGCPAGRYPCGGGGGGGGACYGAADRCNYQTYCPGGADERGCRRCRRGTFRCADGRCIFEAWVCDGQPDCADASDERDCARRRPLPRKVATAAAVGSLVCGLLLVVALGCTCKLYSLRTGHYRLLTPLAHLEAAQRRAPPSYGELIAQGAIPPVEDFPTENPNDTSVIGNIRSILQLLRQEPPHRPSRRSRRRSRFMRRLFRRIRRIRLCSLLRPSSARGPRPAEPAVGQGPAGSAPTPATPALPLPRKFPLLDGAPRPTAPSAEGPSPDPDPSWARSGRQAEVSAGDVLLLPLGDPSPGEVAHDDREALLC